MPEPDPERSKLRRWAVEQIMQTASIDMAGDVARVCRAADALIEYIETGKHPRATGGDGQSQG